MRHFVGCAGFSARSDRSSRDIPDATGRLSFTGCLGRRLRRRNLDSMRVSSVNCVCTALGNGAGGGAPAVNFVSRVSADPSTDKGSVGTHIVRGCSNRSVRLDPNVVSDMRGFPRLGTRGNRSVVMASKAALLNTSSGTNVTRVMRTVYCLHSRGRVGRKSVHINFGPSRRVNVNTRRFSMRGFNYS